jgi:predicted enzyme related to lactoylglutathione lyase
MKVLGVSWVGVRTTKYIESRRFFEHVLGMHATTEGIDFSVHRTTSGDVLEIFGPRAELSEPEQFGRNRVVVGLLVDDIENACSELQAAGVELLGKLQKTPDGYAWQHFRAPDGNVWELVFDPNHALTAKAR